MICTLYLFDLAVILPITFESVFQFEKEDHEQIQRIQQYNYFYFLEQQGILQYITNVLNAYLFALIAFVSFIFIKYDYDVTRIRDYQGNYIISCTSFLILFTGRFLSNLILGFQISTIKCGFTITECHSKTNQGSVIVSFIGILANIIVVYAQFVWFELKIPVRNIPWASSSNNYLFIQRLILLIGIFILALEDQLLKIVAYYVILIPILILQTIQIWIVLNHQIAFNNLIEGCLIVRDNTVWTLSLIATIILLSSEASDPMYIVISIGMIITCSISLYHIRQIRKRKLFKIVKCQYSNTLIQEKVIHNFMEFSRQPIGSIEDTLLQYFYQKHLYACIDEKCPCQSVIKFTVKKEGRKPVSKLSQPIYNAQQMDVIENMNQMEKDHFIRSQFFKGLFGKISNAVQKSSSNNVVAQTSHQNINQKGLRYSEKELLDQEDYISMRNDMIQKILFHIFKSQNYSISIQLLEVFLKVEVYSRIYQGLYQLMFLKKNCKTSNKNKKLYSYLNLMIIGRSKQIDFEDKRDVFNADKALIVDYNFQDYKRMIVETTILVEKFWFDLRRQDFDMRQIIQIGKRIVDNFLVIKKLYEIVIEEKPDFREIVVLSIQFNANVLNFEIEAIQLQNYLKNLDQKLKINKMNSYDDQQWRTNSGLIIMSQKPSKKNRIMLINKHALELIKYNLIDVIKKDVNLLMPSFIAAVHDKLIEKYLCSDKNSQDTNLRRVWVRSSEGHIIPVKIQIKTYISESRGLLMVAYMDPIQQIKKKNLQSKISDSYFLLTDEEGYVIQTSENFAKDFLGSNSYVQDVKINIDDMFQELYKYSDKEMKGGIKTCINLDFKHNGTAGISYQNFDDSQQFHPNIKMREVTLVQIKYKLLNKVFFKEIIFTVDSSSLYNIQNKNHTIEFFDREGSISEKYQEADQEDDVNFGHGSDSSASSVSDSLRSNELLQTKQIIDFQTIPQSIQNVRRAIIMFFMTIAATSFAVLAVSLISNNQFKSDQTSVRNSIYLIGQLANIRLTFRMLTQSLYLPSEVQAYNYTELQGMLSIYYFNVKYYHQQMLHDDYDSSSQLNYYMKENALNLAELQNDGSISSYNTTFTIGIQQYLTKLEAFMEMDISRFKTIMTQYIFNSEGLPAQNIYQKNAWFIIQNGNHQIRNFCLKIETLYIQEGQSKKFSYDTTVLIICVSCIGVTIIISLIFIPVTFALDNEEKEIVSYWMLIKENAIVEILTQITQFNVFMNNESGEKIKFENESHKIENPYEDQTLYLDIPSKLGEVVQNESYDRTNFQMPGIMDLITPGSSGLIIRHSDKDESLQQNNPLFQKLNIPKKGENSNKILGKEGPRYQTFQSILNHSSQNKNLPKQLSINYQGVNSLNRIAEDSQISRGFSTIQELDNQNHTNNNMGVKFKEDSSSISIGAIKDQKEPKGKGKHSSRQHANTSSGYQNTHHNLVMMSFGTQHNQHHTTLDQSYLNQSGDDLIIKQSIQNEQQIQLNKIFIREKIKKTSVIMSFSTVIIGFYLASYFICGSIFLESSQSFDYQKISSRRGTCLSASFNVLIEKLAQNKSQGIGPLLTNLEYYIREDCANFESSYQEYIRSPPSQLESIHSFLIDVDDKLACKYAFIDQPDTFQSCENYMNGILSKGLRTVIQSSNYFLLTQNNKFESQAPFERTRLFLDSLESNSKFQQYLKLVLDYIIPITDDVRLKIDKAITDFLEFKIDQFIIIFSVFMVFLLISLVVALKYVIQILKRVVFRSRILIKIIPTRELKRINTLLKNRKKY
eukprot:403374925